MLDSKSSKKYLQNIMVGFSPTFRPSVHNSGLHSTDPLKKKKKKQNDLFADFIQKEELPLFSKDSLFTYVPEMQAMANLAILTKYCHSHNGDEFGKFLPNSHINAINLNTWKPAMLVDLTILANVTNLANFSQSAKCMQIS